MFPWFCYFRVDLKPFFSSVVQGVKSLQSDSDDRLQLGDDLWPHTDEVTGGDRGRHDEHQVSEHCGWNYHWKPSQGTVTNIQTRKENIHKPSLDMSRAHLDRYLARLQTCHCRFLKLRHRGRPLGGIRPSACRLERGGPAFTLPHCASQTMTVRLL